MANRSEKKQEKFKQYHKQLKSGEQLIASGEFSCSPVILLYFAAAAGFFIAGRLTLGNNMAMMLTNMGGMLMMFDAAKVLVYAQESCLLITDKRILGISGERKFDIPYNNIKQCRFTSKIFVEAGQHNSVILKCLKNREEVKAAITQHLK